ncbi:UPF0764 protein C16orf89 homolog [Babylonia areolata]|uniref:UPF0764 protein C16orf89 homolog n=1 Tax=Babylonia areolata TaxID=304850 RepID=UPI003FD059F5
MRPQTPNTATKPSPSSSSSSSSSSSTVVLKVMVTLVLLLLVPTSSAGGRWTREGHEKEREKEKEERLLGNAMDGVEGALAFFSEDVSNINLDGLFGLRFAQGHIIQALKECQSSGPCPARLQLRLQAVRDAIETTALAGMDYVQETDYDYFRQFQPIVDRPYILRYIPVTLTDLDLTPAGTNQSYDENLGDSCFAGVLGTSVENGKRVKRCNITRTCWHMMTEAGRSGYSITHQLLYFILIEQEGCPNSAGNTMGYDAKETEARLCGSIYNEAASEVKVGGVEEESQDLFLEQVMLCGSLGFENFLRTDWIRMVLTWQKASGCFSMDDPATLVVMETESALDHLLKDLKVEGRMIEKQHHGRKLLREQLMSDGCLSHKTGLGFGTVSLYTRYLIRQLFIHQ